MDPAPPVRAGALPRLFVVQFLSWSAMFCLWVYALPVIATLLGGDLASALPEASLYFAYYAILASVLTFAQPWLVARVPAGLVLGGALIIGGAGLAMIALATRPLLLAGAFTALGVAWSAMGTIPYAAASAAARPGQGAATLRRFGFSTVLPQAVTTLALALAIMRWHLAARDVLIGGAVAMAAAGVLACAWRGWIVVPPEDW